MKDEIPSTAVVQAVTEQGLSGQASSPPESKDEKNRKYEIPSNVMKCYGHADEQFKFQIKLILRLIMRYEMQSILYTRQREF